MFMSTSRETHWNRRAWTVSIIYAQLTSFTSIMKAKIHSKIWGKMKVSSIMWRMDQEWKEKCINWPVINWKVAWNPLLPLLGQNPLFNSSIKKGPLDNILSGIWLAQELFDISQFPLIYKNIVNISLFSQLSMNNGHTWKNIDHQIISLEMNNHHR